MRRKRAAATGKTANTDLRNLRPGRRIKERKRCPKTYKQRGKDAFGLLQVEGQRSLDLETDDSGNEVGECGNELSSPIPELKPNSGDKESDEEPLYSLSEGELRRPHNLRKFFLENELDAAKIMNMELDLFCFSKMAKLLGYVYFGFIKPRNHSHR